MLLVLLASAPATSGGDDLSAALRSLARDQPETVTAIGERIRFNETGGHDEWLIAWLVGEQHLSLGIGHFIWYPAGRAGPFRESFVDLLDFLNGRGSPAPPWLTSETPCPWPSREAFLEASHHPRLLELRALVESTIDGQTAFLIERLASSIPALLAGASAAERPVVEERLEQLLRPRGEIDPDGVYALVDYVNFKGEGLAPAERYQGEGWGLLQVLEGMGGSAAGQSSDATLAPLAAFARSAAQVLEHRVALSPPERREARWLANWRARVATYAHGLDR